MIFRRRSKTTPSSESLAYETIAKSDLFDASWYLNQYPDVAQAGFDPILHYVRHGAAEGRQPGPWFDPQKYVSSIQEDIGEQNPLLHYLASDQVVHIKSPKVGPKYRNLNEFLRFTATNPVVHAPFQEEDRRCFSVMEHLACRLAKLSEIDSTVKVSVIMPVKNRVETLAESVSSVLRQTYRNFELFIIDDASNDGSDVLARELSATDSRIHVIQHTAHVGVSAARNSGLVASTGQVIAYLDSDNLWDVSYLAACIGAFYELPDVDAIYSGQFLYSDLNAESLTAVRFGPFNKSLLEQHNYIDINCFSHRRSILRHGIVFDAKLHRLVDWDFILKISDVFKVASVPVLLSHYFYHKATNTITKDISIEPALLEIKSTRALRHASLSAVNLSRPCCVVIPSYEALPFLKACLESLEFNLQSNLFEVVIVDNNSSEEVKNYLKEINRRNIKVIFNDVNFGFSYAVNQGVEHASPDADIIILNNDARVLPSSLGVLQNLAYSNEDIAITVPRQIVPAGSADISSHVPYAYKDDSCDVSLSSHHSNIDWLSLYHHGDEFDLSFAPFFCVYIKRTIWNESAGLDYENGRHYRSDRIMCDFVKNLLRKRIVYTSKSIVYHGSQVSTNELSRVKSGIDSDYDQMLVKNIWPENLMIDLDIKHRPWN